MKQLTALRHLILVFALLALGWTLTGRADTLINGAGATFPYPLYSKWISEFQKVDPSAQINYQSIGSGGGIRQFTEKTVDFGATDAPMTDEQIAKLPAPALHVPTVLGAVVVTYNLPGIPPGLHLDGPTLAALFLGDAKTWNDPRIAKLNPGMNLPSDPVIVVHRSDGSGTSYVFTDYLTKASSDWAQKVGKGTAVNWPAGLGGKGNEGVSGTVKQTPGSIGYVELVFAETNHLPYATLKNKSGRWVTPSLKSVTAAGAGSLKDMPDDFRTSVTDAPGMDSYPISSYTYLLIYKEMPKEKGAPLLKFIHWGLKAGQALAPPLLYSPLPTPLVKRVEAKLKGVMLK